MIFSNEVILDILIFFLNKRFFLFQILFGERIEIPHEMNCNCNECKLTGLDDSLRYSQLRLAIYRALSSEVYLALVSLDPITSAFELTGQLSKLIDDEPNLASEYLILYEQVSQFSSRLLDHIQNEVELELLITNQRLQAAIEYNQKEFMIHSNTQQRLNDIWYENIDDIRSNTQHKRFLATVYHVLIYIPMYFAHFWLVIIFKDRCRWYFEQAAIQALIHGIAYHIFLFLIILLSSYRTPTISIRQTHPQIVNYYDRFLFLDTQTIDYSKPDLSYLRLTILVFMFAYVYRNIKQIIRLRRWLQAIEMLMTMLFICYIILSIAEHIQTHVQWSFRLNIDNWKEFERLHNSSQLSDKYFAMKTKLLFNQTIDSIDIPIVADSIYALIILCCIVHLCSISIMSEYFGPLLLSLITTSRMIYRWFILIFIFVSAYDTAFVNLFSYYSDEKVYGRVNFTDFNRTVRAGISRSFGNFKLTTINTFLSLFGLTKNELTQTYINFDSSSIEYYFLNFFTSIIGSFIYGSFAVFARIVLITMIIAYIKRIYGLSKEQVFDNWKFARAKYYMKFISKELDVLPVPLNLIPTPRHFMNILRRKLSNKNLQRKKSPENQFLRNLNYFSSNYKLPKTTTIDDVINKIVSRFLTQYHPFDAQQLKRARQNQYKEQLSDIRRFILDEIQTIQQTNQLHSRQISTIFFQIDKH